MLISISIYLCLYFYLLLILFLWKTLTVLHLVLVLGFLSPCDPSEYLVHGLTHRRWKRMCAVSLTSAGGKNDGVGWESQFSIRTMTWYDFKFPEPLQPHS